MVLVEGSDNSSFDKLRTSGVVARIDLFTLGWRCGARGRFVVVLLICRVF